VPGTATITTNSDGSKTSFANVSYTGPTFTIPSTLSVESYTALSTNSQNQIIQDYKLASGSGTFKVWHGSDFSMVYNSQTGQYTLSANQQPTTLTPGIDSAKVTQTAQAFATKYFGASPLLVITQEISYGIDEQISTITADKALFANLPLSYVIDGYPVTVSANNLYPLIVTVNSANQVTKATFVPAQLQMTSLGKKPTLTVTQALANINKGQAAVTSVFQENFQPIDLTSITSAAMTSVKVQYRVDAASNLIYPFYIFDGTGTNAQNTALNLEISTPAVAITAQ